MEWTREENEAVLELMAMTPEELKLVPHDKVRWVCICKGCKRTTGVMDFGIDPMFGWLNGRKVHWIDPSVTCFLCAKHWKLFSRLKKLYPIPHIERRLYDVTKTFIIRPDSGK